MLKSEITQDVSFQTMLLIVKDKKIHGIPFA
jgi:hypothetical protein